MNTRVDTVGASDAGLGKAAGLRLVRAFIMLALFGAGIGLLRHQDLLVAGLLTVVTLLAYVQTCRRVNSTSEAILIAAGILLTGAIGVTAERWGIGNGHWAYHDLPDGRTFARWLPQAWGLAFLFLYRLERFFVENFRFDSLGRKMALSIVMAVVFPAWGEAIAIQSGVWTYYWPYQILGVPLLAIAMLAVGHTLIFSLFLLISRTCGLKQSMFYCKP